MRYYIYGIICLSTFNKSACSQDLVTPFSYPSAGFQYIQPFDSLPNAGNYLLANKGPFAFSSPPFHINQLMGWQFWMSGGSNSSANFGISTGSSTGNGIYSFGNTGNTDRALGSLSSSTGSYSFGFILTNNTGTILNKFSLNFIAEQWRKGGSTNKNFWIFSYTTGIISSIQQTGLIAEPLGNFQSIINTSTGGSLDGNLPNNQQIISFSVSNITWKNGEQLLLRWDDADETGSDDGMGIDNFSFSAQIESSKPIVENIFSSNISSDTALLIGNIRENYANTTVIFEYDTTNTFLNPQSTIAIPGIIYPGSGLTNVSSTVSGLLAGTDYYFRIKATNINGTTISNTASFTTTFQTLDLTTLVAEKITKNSALLGGKISQTNHSIILENGIVWSLHANPTIVDNKISMSIVSGNFSQTVSGFSPGTNIYIKSFIKTTNEVLYGNTQTFTTKTQLVSIHTKSNTKTNDSLVQFEIKYLQNITGISTSNFELNNTGIIGAYIKSISGSGDLFTIIVNTGMGDGSICLSQINSTGIVPEIENLPNISSTCYTIDKSVPFIRSIEIPNNTMIIDDTIPVFVLVTPDKDMYNMKKGNINDFPLFTFTKITDSTYIAYFTIDNSSSDVKASDNLAVTVILIDTVGNTNLPLLYSIIQSNDLIDANRPSIKNISIPPNGQYKIGDSLQFIFHFSEKINITLLGSPATLSITIGTKTKTAILIKTDTSNILLFKYIIQPGDADKDGIKIGSSIILKQTIIKDLAGNTAILGYNNVPSTKNIFIDAIAPTVSSVITPPPGIYKTGYKLDFTINFTKKVMVKNTILPPTLSMIIGTKQKNAIYKSGSGSSSLLFTYVIEKDDFDKDGIKLTAAILLNDATIIDEIGNEASLNLNNIGALSKININPVTAAVQSVNFPLNGIYKKFDTLSFVVNFSENVFINASNGNPSLKINIRTQSNHAYLKSGSGTSSLLFIYIIQPGEEDTNGIKINTSISLNSGILKDSLGNHVPISLTKIPSGLGIIIDGISPIIKNVLVPTKDIYIENDTLNFYVVFSENAIRNPQSDIPYITIQIGIQFQRLKYESGSETAIWLFRYIVQKGNLDKNGIRIDSFIVAGNSNITDKAGNLAILTIKNIGAQSFVKIDAMAPIFYTDKSTSLATCENNLVLPISDPLSIADDEVGEQIIWQIVNKPKHGVISNSVFQTYSTGKMMTPNGISYFPDKNFQGLDSFIVEISDNVNKSQKKILIQILPLITNNTIGPSQLICMNTIPDTISGSKPIGGDQIFKSYWQASIVADTTNFNTADSTNKIHFFSSPPLSQTTWFRRKLISGECVDFSNALQIKVIKKGIWTGSVNNEWQNKNNWCNGEIPDISTSVFINGNTPNIPIIYETAICHHLTILKNATLIVKGVLQIGGMIDTYANQIDAIHGTVIFSGKATQSIPKNSFKNETIGKLIINNTDSVYLYGKIVITKMLQLQSGAFITNNYLQIDNSAEIGPCAAGTSITDTVSIRKLIAGGKRGFLLIGNPFSHDLSLESIKDSIDITGIGGKVNGFTNSADNEPSAFKHDPIIGNDSLGINAGWIAFTNTNGLSLNVWKKQTGIRLLYRGSRGQGLDNLNVSNGIYYPNASILNLKGHITTGDKEIELINGVHAGYHVVSNPYPAKVNLSLISKGRNIGAHYWIWNPYQGKMGGYSPIPFANHYILESFGTFIVKSNANNHNQILFTENCKVSENAADSLPNIIEDNTHHLEMRLESDSVFWDRIILFGIDSAKSNFDKQDAEKFNNPDLNFYSISRDQKMLSIDARPVNNESLIPLGIQSNEKGLFSLRISKVALPNNNHLQLHDKFLNNWMKLEENNRYPFLITTDTNSMGNNRFEITAQKKPVSIRNNQSKLILLTTPIPANDKLLVKFVSPERANTQIRIINLNGIPIKKISLGLQKEGQIMLSVADMTKGIYILELVCGDQVNSQKIIKQ